MLDRPANPHIGFGHGVHYCVGAHLARLELRVAIERVLARLPGLRPAVPEHELRWKQDAMVNGLQALPDAWCAGARTTTRTTGTDHDRREGRGDWHADAKP